MNNGRFDLTVGATKRAKPPRMILYGPPGIGKTTTGCSAPNPVMIATEDGSDGVEVARLPTDGKCKSWKDILDALDTLVSAKHEFKTVIIDTLNGAEKLCMDAVCLRDFGGAWTSKSGQEGFNAWAKGATATAQEFTKILNKLDGLRNTHGMECILLAHAGLQKSGNALGEDFQKFVPDIDKRTWAVVHGWSDMIGHADRELRVTKDKSGKFKARAVGQERYVYWEGNPGRDAKSRLGYEMPSRTLLSYEDIARALKADWRTELVAEIMELFPQMPKEVQTKMKKWLGGPSKVTKKHLMTFEKVKLENIVNRMLANIPEQE